MDINQDVLTNSATLFGAVGAVIFGLQKAIKSWSADRGEIQKIGIDSELFQRLSAELTRLTATNQAQEKEIQELRDKFSALLNDFTTFRIESIKRDAELVALKERLKRYEP